MQADLGLIGLAVMGQNLVLNMADHKFTVAVFNRTTSKTDEFLKGPAKGKSIIGCHDLASFVRSLKKPRRIMLMVKAGSPVDEFIDHLIPLLEQGDILIDGGNSFYPDTQRRYEALKEKGILFIGAGISGGEEGARHGPSIMPGGNRDAWPHVKGIFQAIAARSEEGEPCCDWVGEGGAGHYVKMVHNGIEYGDIQLICEAYHLLHGGLHIDYPELINIFKEWNRGVLDSYLVEITADIFQIKDRDGTPLLEHILDVAGQKGTGKWTGISALELDVPVTLIGEAVFARCLSALREERTQASKLYPNAKKVAQFEPKKIADALYASKITSYAQGFMLMRSASQQNKWNLNFGAIALMWRAGCIIRSRFLGKIKDAYAKNANLPNLLADPFFVGELSRCHQAWRETVAFGVLSSIPLPCMSAGLAFFDGYRSARLPANLLQAQRDFFGAHTYERTDQPRGQFFHTNWTGKGGDVALRSIMHNHSAWFEIDLAQFQKNLQAIRRRVGSSRLCCVVKANAYGHGLVPIAQEAERIGVDYLAVVHTHEGIALRQAGVRSAILVLGAFQEEQLEELMRNNLEFVLSSPFKARVAAQKAAQLGLNGSVHVEVDTGMRRTGVRLENARALIDLVSNHSCFTLKGVYSHFVSSEQPNDPTTLRQLEQFVRFKESFGAVSFLWHLANSGGVLFYPDSLLDMVRPGFLCYQDVLSLKARISYFKVVDAGEGISYGHTYRTRDATRVVTVPVGYGDGYRRDFSNKMSVLLRGKRHPIVGAICMDQMMVDIGMDEAYVGDEVVILGRQKDEEITCRELAEAVHTDPREILCHFNERIPRIYSALRTSIKAD